MPKASELLPGDEVLGWMRTGLALKRARNSTTGEIYRYCPRQGVQSDNDDLQKFKGLITANDTNLRVLTIEVQEVSRNTMASSLSLRAQVPYSALWKLRRFSKFSYPARLPNPKRPTQASVFGGGYRPFRTVEEVDLRS